MAREEIATVRPTNIKTRITNEIAERISAKADQVIVFSWKSNHDEDQFFTIVTPDLEAFAILASLDVAFDVEIGPRCTAVRSGETPEDPHWRAVYCGTSRKGAFDAANDYLAATRLPNRDRQMIITSWSAPGGAE